MSLYDRGGRTRVSRGSSCTCTAWRLLSPVPVSWVLRRVLSRLRRSAACQRRVEARSLRYDLHYSQNFDDDSLAGSSGGHLS